MLIRSPQDVTPQEMTMPGAAGVKMRLMVGREDGAPNFAMRLFEVAPGGHTPKHAHNYEHEVLIVQGSANLACGPEGDQTRHASAGDVVFVPANETHQFVNTGPGTLKFMCLVPVTFDCGHGACQPTPGS